MHILEPNERTARDAFSASFDPVLTIQSGDTVRYRHVLDAAWLDGTGTTSPLTETVSHNGHALVGPIAIEGAKPGMVLAVHVGEIITAPKGWNIGGGPGLELWQKLGTELPERPPRTWWEINRETMTATNPTGQTVRVAPFMGVMGMPPGPEGSHPTPPPRFTGGNIDCKLLTAGSTLYLPIAVEGGLFSTGDGHAAQGDGEVSLTAIECSIEQVDLTFTLLPDMHLSTPRALTSEGKITLGFHEDLDEATYIALNAMLDWLIELYGFTRQDALSLASVAVDMRITQIVNGVKGVHALLPDGAVW